jgi:predicted dehydrogenase
LASPLRIGIAGLGFGAQAYVPIIRRLKDAQLCALADGGSNSARDFASSFLPTPHSYSNGRAMIEEGEIDCIIAAVPPMAQTELVQSALKRGIAVLCEKPCGATLQECAGLVALAEEGEVCAAAGLEYRYEAGIAGLIDLVRNGEIGAVTEISVVWRTRGGLNPNRLWSWRDDTTCGGGVLNEFCTHVFDYLPLLAGAPIDRVRCTARTIVTERPDKNGTMRPVLAPDDVEIEGVFENGVSTKVNVSNASSERSGHHIKVQGELGTAQFDHATPFALGGSSLAVETRKGRSMQTLPRNDPFDGLDSRCPAIAEMVDDFLRSLRGENRQRMAKLSDCHVARQCISAAELSSASGQWAPRQTQRST